jgi:hypothetical protein
MQSIRFALAAATGADRIIYAIGGEAEYPALAIVEGYTADGSVSNPRAISRIAVPALGCGPRCLRASSYINAVVHGERRLTEFPLDWGGNRGVRF